MSLVVNSPFTCPDCGMELSIPVWGSITVDSDPELREAILKGEHFLFTCPECGGVSSVMYNCVYSDRSRKQIFGLIPENSDEENAEEQLKAAAEGLVAPCEEYILRVVRSGDDLREKLLIFDSGLDDRIVEVCKGVALSQMSQESYVADIRFFTAVGQRFLVLYCGEDGEEEQYVTGFDSFYKQMEEEFGHYMPSLYSREFTEVNLDYVSALIRE